MNRVLYSALILVCFGLLPWPMIAGMLFAGMFWYRNYYEGIAGFMLFDMMYAIDSISDITVQNMTFSGIGIACFFVSIMVKNNLRAYV